MKKYFHSFRISKTFLGKQIFVETFNRNLSGFPVILMPFCQDPLPSCLPKDITTHVIFFPLRK